MEEENLGSTYQSLRSSWPIDVCYNIYNKTGTTNKNKKISLKQTIRNWVNTEDYMIAYRISIQVQATHNGKITTWKN